VEEPEGEEEGEPVPYEKGREEEVAPLGLPKAAPAAWMNVEELPRLARSVEARELDLPLSFYAADPGLRKLRQGVLTFFRRMAVREIGGRPFDLPRVLFKAAQLLDCYLLERGHC
jgi:hypothetical protein